MNKKYLAGGIAIALGVIWITGITYSLITSFLPVSLPNPEAWAQQIYFPSSTVSTLLYIFFLLAWVFYSHTKRCKSSADAKMALGPWLMLLGMSWLSNVVCLVLFIQLTVVQAPANQSAMQGGSFVNNPPYEYLIPLALVNALLLFWLPSVFLTQRTLRFVPPFSYQIQSILEKR